MKNEIKRFLDYHINSQIRRYSAEIVFQGVFNRQCERLPLENNFYPVGAPASYGLMNLLLRILEKNLLQDIVELGSGQSTILIDRFVGGKSRHVCYEHDKAWYDRMRGRLSTCDYRLRSLAAQTIEGISTEWYADADRHAFDLLLIDGPEGVERFSRAGCLSLILSPLLKKPHTIQCWDEMQTQNGRPAS